MKDPSQFNRQRSFVMLYNLPMPKPRLSRKHLPRSKSRSPLVSPNDERGDPVSSKKSGSVAFVPFQLGPASGVSKDTRKAVRVQAAKASAAARKRTIARRLAEKNGTSPDEAVLPVSSPEDRGKRLSSPSSTSSRCVTLPSSPLPVQEPDSTTILRKDSHIDFVDPLALYPTSIWHPLIPKLVDHFLKYFAPERHTDMQGREALRTHLWPMALEEPPLFHAIMLTIASHASVSGALKVPMDLLAQLKHTTLEGIQEALTDPASQGNFGDSVVGAIAFLGAWELEYGVPEIYDTHMRGLEVIVNLRGGLSGSLSIQRGSYPLSPATVNLVLQIGNDMALFAGKSPYFNDLSLPTGDLLLDALLSEGLRNLQRQHLVLPDLLHSIQPLTYIYPHAADALPDLKDIKHTLTYWEQFNALRSSYRPHLTLLEDTMQHQASMHIRLAGLSICEYLLLAAGATILEPTEYLHDEIAILQTEMLINSVFEEVTFWALFAICTITGKCGSRQMRSLKRMQLGLEIGSWSSLKALLEQYVYPVFILDSRAHALWEAIYASSIARDGDAGNTEPTRFKSGIRHSTSYLSWNIDSEIG